MIFQVDLTLDCAHPTALAGFYKRAFGYADEPPPAPFATRAEWIASFPPDPAGTGADGAWLHDPAGVLPRLCLQQVPEAKVSKNRLHLDLRVTRGLPPGERAAAVAAAVAHFLAEGATEVVAHDGHHAVLADPEGNEFCVA